MRRVLRRHERVAVCDEPRSTAAEYVRQQYFGVRITGIAERSEAVGALDQQCFYGPYRFLDAFSNPVRSSSRFITGFSSRKSGSTIAGISAGSFKSKTNVADRFPSCAEKYAVSGFSRPIVLSSV